MDPEQRYIELGGFFIDMSKFKNSTYSRWKNAG
jgi:hypothetical protein